MDILKELVKNGFLETKLIENEELHYVSTPCIFRVESDIVQSLKKNYKSTEEIGGVLSAKPLFINKERVFIVDFVNYVRNAIEDNPRTDGKNKSNAYLADPSQINIVISQILNDGCLPIKFHTHPTKGKDYLQTILNEDYQTETSAQDRRASEYSFNINGQKLLLPRALIVGNSITPSIFIGLYGGFIAPMSFEQSKKKVINKRISNTADLFANIELSTVEKIGLGIGAGLLLFSIIKYPKFSLPVIGGLALAAYSSMSNTQNIVKPEYFNRLTYGSAEIYIP